MAEVKLDLPPDLLKVLESLGDLQQTIRECIVLELYRMGRKKNGGTSWTQIHRYFEDFFWQPNNKDL